MELATAYVIRMAGEIRKLVVEAATTPPLSPHPNPNRLRAISGDGSEE